MKYFIFFYIVIVTILIIAKPETKVMTYEGQVSASQLSNQLILK